MHPKDPKLCLSMEDRRDLKKTLGLCIMPTAIRANESLEEAKSEWINDINFFRDKCGEKTKYVQEKEENSAKRLMIDLENKEDGYERIREKSEEDKQKLMEGKIENTTHVALEVIFLLKNL